MMFKHFIREIFSGCDIKCFPEKGYEIHSGHGWAKVIVTDSIKYGMHIKQDLNKIILPNMKIENK